MKNILYGCFILLICTSCGCKKEEVPPEYLRMIFEIPLRITPISDTVQVGDTLWLEASFPDTIRDHNSGKYYKVPPSFDLRTRVGFLRLIFPEKTISEQPGYAPSFKVLNKTGEIKDIGSTFGGVDFAHNYGRYSLSVGVVPNNEGVVSMSFFTRWLVGGVYEDDADLSFLDLGQAPGGRKRIAILDNIYYIINEGNTNFHLMKEHCRTGTEKFNEANYYFEQKATYTFVIE